MTDQETLTEEPPGFFGDARSRLWRNVLTGDTIDRAAWTTAVHAGGFVGTCQCGGYLRPLPADSRGGHMDYEAVCSVESSVHSGGFKPGCGKSIVAPGGRVGGRRGA